MGLLILEWCSTGFGIFVGNFWTYLFLSYVAFGLEFLWDCVLGDFARKYVLTICDSGLGPLKHTYSMILDYPQGSITSKSTQRLENIYFNVETTYKENPQGSNQIITRNILYLSASKGVHGVEFMTF